MNDIPQGSSSYENGPPAKRGVAPAGDLVATSGGRPMLAGPSPFAPPATQDVIRGGFDASTLYHAFRRRWPLALGMGLLAGVLGSGILWYLFPESATAYRYYKVSSSMPGIIDRNMGVDTRDYDIYRQTQVVLIESPQVLSSALEVGQLKDLHFFDGVDEADKVLYLQKQLDVSFQKGSEILEIRLSGATTADELKKIVDAVGAAYQREVQYKEDLDRKKPRDILAESYADLDRDIKRKTDAYFDMIEEVGSPSLYGPAGDPELLAMRHELMDLGKKIQSDQEKLLEAQLNFEMAKRSLEDPAVLEQRIDMAVQSDLKYQSLEQRALAYELQIEDLKASQGNRASSQSKQLQKMANQYRQQMNTLREEMSQAMKERARREPDPQVKQLTMQMMLTRGVMLQQINAAREKQQAILEELRERGKVDPELVAREGEIESLKGVQSSIAERIEHWDIELRQDPRIQPYGLADTAEGINESQRYLIAGVGGLGLLGLTVFGISYLEFRNRKLNGPDQVDEGLGIRVLGVLPSLSSRRALNPNHPVVAQLTESVDSIRTALMHESTTKRRQIVLVTSPSTLEGRTTVSSQLAASLARAGRRTLLIDGDLRHPALHTLFDKPLEDGLCEVLRAECEVSDVVRPTHAEGLWVLTAGYCDADAIHALATDQVQPIFEKLRAEFDFIVIDGAPVLGLSDSLLFGQHCDGAILSVLRDHTSLPKIQQSAELLRNVGIRLLGTVVNGMSGSVDRRITALQSVTNKRERKQLENIEA